MPCGFIEDIRSKHVKLWAKIRAQVNLEMIEQGWCKRAKKFNEVMMRKAYKLLVLAVQ